MANPSRYSMFIRIVGGNVAEPYPGNLSPDDDESKVSAHDIIAALQMWSNGEITKANLVDQYNFTHVNDDSDLENLSTWFDSATKKEKFSNVLEWRIILARDKRGVLGLDGTFGYAVKNTLLDGADGAHSLRDTGPAPARFNNWA